MVTLQHENGNQTKTAADISLTFAMACGYQWINRHDGNGWRQLVIEARKEAIRRAVAA